MYDYCLEIRDQEHLMDFEGSSDEKPTENEIIAIVFKRGYVAENIDIFYDNMQGFYRFRGELCDKSSRSKK